MKKTFAMLTALTLTLLFVASAGSPSVRAQRGTAAATLAGTQPAVDLGGGLQIVTKSSDEESTTPKLSIKLTYPVLTGATGPTVDNFNKIVDQMVNDTASKFKEDAKNNADVTLPPEIADLGSFIEIAYELPTASAALISVKFNVFWYNAGAAHPNSFSLTLNYDVKAGKDLALKDLFKANAKYLKVISDYCIKTLKADGKLDFPEGAQPTEDNYGHWNITDKGLQITFDDYQVTPHAVGPQVVVVPYSVIKSIVNPSGALAPFIK